MKRITKKALPIELNDEIIENLMNIAMEFPQNKEWHNLFDYWIENKIDDFLLISKIVQEKEKAIEKAKSDEQKTLEAEHNKRAYESLSPKIFMEIWGNRMVFMTVKEGMEFGRPASTTASRPPNNIQKLIHIQYTTPRVEEHNH